MEKQKRVLTVTGNGFTVHTETMKTTAKEKFIRAVLAVFFPVPYPIALVPHAIYGVFIAALLGYEGKGTSFPLICIAASIIVSFIVLLLIRTWRRQG